MSRTSCLPDLDLPEKGLAELKELAAACRKAIRKITSDGEPLVLSAKTASARNPQIVTFLPLKIKCSDVVEKLENMLAAIEKEARERFGEEL